MTPLERLAADLARIAANRCLRALKDNAHVFGVAEMSSRDFEPIDWLRERARPGCYRYVCSWWGDEVEVEETEDTTP